MTLCEVCGTPTVYSEALATHVLYRCPSCLKPRLMRSQEARGRVERAGKVDRVTEAAGSIPSIEPRSH